jgi:hypothetical protein
MNSYYAPQNGYYPNHYAPAPQQQYAPQPHYAPMPVAQNSGQGMKVAAGVLALLAIGIAAFAVVFGMKKDANVEATAAQGSPSTVINLPSEINIPSLGSSTTPAPVVVNNPAPRVITVPGQAPVQSQAPAQQAPAQQAPVQQAPAQNNTNDQAEAEAKAKADADAKAENVKKAAGLKAIAASKRTAAQQTRLQASLLLNNDANKAQMLAQADALDAEAASLEAQAAALGG